MDEILIALGGFVGGIYIGVILGMIWSLHHLG